MITTKGSICWRHDLFGLGLSSQRKLVGTPSVDELLGPTRAERLAAETAAGTAELARPSDPRLRAIIEALAGARSSAREARADGRTLLRIERADGGRQLAFSKTEELAAIDGALAAKPA